MTWRDILALVVAIVGLSLLAAAAGAGVGALLRGQRPAEPRVTCGCVWQPQCDGGRP